MNFYDTESFLKRSKNPAHHEDMMISSITYDFIENQQIYISDDIAETVEILDYNDIMFQDLSHKIFINAGKSILPTDAMKDLAVAYACDCYLHPDETVYISDNCEMRSYANIVFGSDMIQAYEDTW